MRNLAVKIFLPFGIANNTRNGNFHTVTMVIAMFS